MANPEDLKLLDVGTVDLSGCDLSGTDLSKRELPGRDFSQANLVSANAQSANLSNSRFRGALLLRINAAGADCSGSDFAGCLLQNVSFANANLRDAVLSSAQIQNGDFREADLRGANFRGASLIGGTRFDGALVDEGTSFDGARGPREFSRSPAFAGHSYEGGIFRSIKPNQGVVAGTRAAGAAISAASPPTARTVFSASTFDPNVFQTSRSDADAADNAAQRLVADPRLFAGLATYAASSINQELEHLGAKIPNEPEALNGYERVRDTLQRLKSDFQSLAETADQVQAAENASEKLSLAKTAVSAAQGICEGFVRWLDQHGPQAGKVIAELGLAGVITGTLTYFTGVSPTLTFSVSVAALSGKNIWEVIAMFAPNKRDDKE
jgi:uncharacterized protein YjbI with pentapeptide repeats